MSNDNSMKNLADNPNIVLLPLSLFILCLLFPPFTLATQYTGDSWELLMTGWMGLLVGWFYWLANPLFFIALLFWKKPKVGLWLSSASFLFAISFMFQEHMIITEAGGTDQIKSFELGYYLWCLAIASLIAIYFLKTFIYTKSGR